VAGAVVLRFKVMRNGVADPDSIEAALATDPAFEEAAVAVVRRMRFTPARISGLPVPRWVSMPIQFKLKRDEAQPSCL
jgi:periplasmic protein TonB